MDTTSLGQIAYEAYWEQEEWVDAQGLPVRSWESVPAVQQSAWQHAGKAVALAVRKAAHQAEIAAMEQDGG